jgi:hypothetical protein
MTALVNFQKIGGSRQGRILESEPYNPNPCILIDRSNFIYPVPAFEKLGSWKDRKRIGLNLKMNHGMREYTYFSLNGIDYTPVE